MVSYAAALILLFLSGYLFIKVSNYQERVDNLSEQMMMQTKTIQNDHKNAISSDGFQFIEIVLCKL